VLGRWEATAIGPTSAAAALHISLGNIHWADGKGNEALSLFMHGAELAAAVGDDRLLGLAESRRGVQLQGMGRIDEALEAYDRSVAISEKTGDLDTLARTLNNRSMIHGMYRHDWVRGTADLERTIEVARQLGNPAQLAFGLNSLGQTRWAAGDWVQARVLFDEAARIARQLGVSRGSEAIALDANLRLLMGDVESATRELEECVRTGRQRKDTGLFASAQEFLARWDLVQNRPEEAQRRMEEVVDAPDLEEQARWWLQSLLATALARNGELDRADALVNEGLTGARQSGFLLEISQWCIATGNVRAHQGRWDDARAAFHESLAIARCGGAVFFAAGALHDYGLMETLAGNREAACALFEEEMTLLQPMGATPLMAQTEQELARLR
jgi:tetratricopeptide (TPR) repeat protein